MQVSAPDGCTMSRRKQAKPQHIDSEEPASGANGEFYARHKVRFSQKKGEKGAQEAKVGEWGDVPRRRAQRRRLKANFGASVALWPVDVCWNRSGWNSAADLGMIFNTMQVFGRKGRFFKWPFLARDGLDEFPSLIWLCGWNRQPGWRTEVVWRWKRTPLIHSTIRQNCWAWKFVGKWTVPLICPELFSHV